MTHKHPRWRPGKHRAVWREGRPPSWNRFFFIRFLLASLSFGFIVLGGIAFVTLQIARLLPEGSEIAASTWLQACGLTFVLAMMAFALARRMFRRTVTPVTDILTAVTNVADGDLSVTLPDYGSGQFGQLGRAFNRMVAELAAADQQRRNLAADVAHELRTPLHIIQGNLEGIIDGVYEPNQTHIEATLEETQALARLVDDLQTLTLAEAGQLTLVQETVALAELLADVQTSFSGQMEVAEIDFGLVMAEGSENWAVQGDTGRLNQVLGILMMNAIRHTPAGGRIELQLTAEDEIYQIVVADTGEGIPAQELPYIFNRFWRGDKARTHSQGSGAGLGLSIAQQLIRAHEGTIDVASEVGQGTRFEIRLPKRVFGPY